MILLSEIILRKDQYSTVFVTARIRLVSDKITFQFLWLLQLIILRTEIRTGTEQWTSWLILKQIGLKKIRKIALHLIGSSFIKGIAVKTDKACPQRFC